MASSVVIPLTPLSLAIADLHIALDWAEFIGGLPALIERSMTSLAHVETWVESTSWVSFLADAPETRSNTSICLSIVDQDVKALGQAEQNAFAKRMVSLCAEQMVAFDIGAYRTAPAGLRIWAGPTVEPDDVALLLPWLDWAFATAKNELLK